MNIAKYGVLSHYPHPNRSEHVNIGIVVFRHDGTVRAHFGDDLRKLRAIDPRANIETVRSWEAGIPEMVKGMSASDAHSFLQHFGTWRVSEDLGAFSYASDNEYLLRVQNALASLVTPAPRISAGRELTSRLHVDLKKTFNLYGWLGSNIDAHQIVTRYRLGPEVSAEFALKNGRLHVIETLDLRTANTSQKRTEAQAKALAFDMASRVDKNAARYAVLAGMNSTLAEATGRPGLPIPPVQ